MKKATIKLLIIAIFTSVAFNVFAEETIYLTTGEYLPDYSETYRHYGLMPHIVTEAFALENITTRWEFVPWVRARLLVQDRHKDASCCWARTKERQQHFIYSVPVKTRVYVLFHLKSFKFNWKTLDDLKDIPIGATIGYTYGKAFEHAEKTGNIKVERVPSDEINFRKLLAGHIKLYATVKEAGYATISKLGANKTEVITHHPRPFYIYNIHVIVSREHRKGQQIIEQFNNGLKKLKASGRYDKFLEDAEKGYYSR